MAKQFKKTKLATAMSIAAVSLGLSATADAVVVVGGDNGWEVSFDGNINAFYTITDGDAGYTALGYEPATVGGAPVLAPDIDQQRVQTGHGSLQLRAGNSERQREEPGLRRWRPAFGAGDSGFEHRHA